MRQPRISAPAASIPSWRRCSKTSASSRPTLLAARPRENRPPRFPKPSKMSLQRRCLIAERMTASGPEKVFTITPDYVKQMVATIVKDQDLSRYIL